MKATPLVAALAIRAIVELSTGEKLSRTSSRKFACWHQDLGHNARDTISRVMDLSPDTTDPAERMILERMTALLPTFRQEFLAKVMAGDPYVKQLQAAYPVARGKAKA